MDVEGADDPNNIVVLSRQHPLQRYCQPYQFKWFVPGWKNDPSKKDNCRALYELSEQHKQDSK